MAYDFDWHRQHGEKTSSSAATVLRILFSINKPTSVLDLGCGDGRWLEQCLALGVGDIQGVDGPWTDTSKLLIPKNKVLVQDLSAPVQLERTFDLAMSMEVAEHVAGESADTFVRSLTRHSDMILFGAAIPFQGGYRHINEQWPSYWRAKFKLEGYEAFDPLRNLIWTDQNCHYWYKQNLLVYIKATSRHRVAQIMEFFHSTGATQLPTDIVHPEKFSAIASYRQIAFRPLLKELPVATIRKMGQLVQRKV